MDLLTQQGVRYATVDGALREVVVATASDVQNLPASAGAEPGVYVVGTGNTGAAQTFQVLGVTYLGAMLAGAMAQRVPHPDWKPEGWTPPTDGAGLVSAHSVHYNEALRTPQFALFWCAVAGNAIAGVTIMSCAKTIMSDVFGSVLPAVVHGGFAAAYVAALSGSNMAGRFGWAAASDYLGRKNTYNLFGLGIPICLGLPLLTNHMIAK